MILKTESKCYCNSIEIPLMIMCYSWVSSGSERFAGTKCSKKSNNNRMLLRNSTVKASYFVHLEIYRISSIKGRRKHACPIYGMSTPIPEATSTCIRLTNANTLPRKKRMQIQLSVANSSPVPRSRNDAVGTVCMQHKSPTLLREYN